jgi:hypothetical protein
MDAALPSSRAPKALRGDTLRSALRELGGNDAPTSARATETTLRSANPLTLAPSEPPPDDDEPAPSALRPDQLAVWLQARG